ncbi:MAG: rod-binding protein [Phycisphaerales bacterium]
MDISGLKFQPALNPLDALPRVPNAQNQLDFTEVLGKQTGRQIGKPDAEKIQNAAENFVAIALVQPVFKQMRAASQAEPPFGPSKAEKQFQSLMDAQVARKIVHNTHWPVVERVAQQMRWKAGLEQMPRFGA